MRSKSIFLTIALAVIFPSAVIAADDDELNNIYRLFSLSPVDVDEIAEYYADNVIHVGRPDAPLITGKETFLAINIAPLSEMVNSGQLTFEGTVYVVRRIVSGNMANDVGYLHSKVTMQGGESMEQVQKFSWVFMKEDETWRVVTDFDATPAPLEVLDAIDAEFIIK